jgi:septum formation protein
MDPNASPAQQVAQVSRRKAEAIPRMPEDAVIAADTIVVCNGQILGKPTDAEDASRMLHLLSGRDHQVMTGMTVMRGDRCLTCTEITDIHFRCLSDKEINAYIRTGEPMDKAGSYGIQGGAALFAEKLSGDYYNVMGLPVCRLGQILKQISPELLEEKE